MLDEIQSHLRGIPRGRIFQRRRLGVFKDVYELVLQGIVGHPTIIVLESLILVFL